MSTRAVRVVSYNLLHGIDLSTGPQVDLAAAAEVIAALDADIVALQEVDRGQQRSGGVDQVGELATRLDMTGVFCPALRGNPDEQWEPVEDDADGPTYGVGLLLRDHPVSVHRVPLPGGGAGRRGPEASPNRPGWDREPRVALRAVVAGGQGRLTVLVTHLSYLPLRALRQLRVALDALTTEPGGPAVLVGDLNLPAWVVRGVARGVRHAGGEPTFPAWRPRLQMHHVLVAGPLDVMEAVAHPRTTSDHRPLVVDLRPRDRTDP